MQDLLLLTSLAFFIDPTSKLHHVKVFDVIYTKVITFLSW